MKRRGEKLAIKSSLRGLLNNNIDKSFNVYIFDSNNQFFVSSNLLGRNFLKLYHNDNNFHIQEHKTNKNIAVIYYSY